MISDGKNKKNNKRKVIEMDMREEDEEDSIMDISIDYIPEASGAEERRK